MFFLKRERERERIMSRMVVRMNVIQGNGLIPIKNPPGKSWYFRTKAIKTPSRGRGECTVPSYTLFSSVVDPDLLSLSLRQKINLLRFS